MRLVVDGVHFEVTDKGSGHVVLLLHGFPDSAKLWKHQARKYLCHSLSPWRHSSCRAQLADLPACRSLYTSLCTVLVIIFA